MNVLILTKQLYLNLWRHFRWRVPMLIFLIIIASFMEGLTLSLLLPLLSVLGIIDGGLSQMEIFNNLFARFGLTISLSHVVIAICVLVVLQYAFILLQNWTSASIQSRYLRKLRQGTFNRLLLARWSFFAKRQVGELITFVTTETSRASSAVYVVVQLISSIATTIIFISIALMFSWQLTFLLLGAALLVSLVLYPIMIWSRNLGIETSVQVSRSMSWLNEALNGVKLIKATAAESHVSDHNNQIETKLALIQRGMLFQPHLLRVIFEATGIILLLCTLALATQYLGLEGGIVITIVVLFMRLYPRLGNLQHLLQQLFMTLPAVENLGRFNRELDTELESLGKPDSKVQSEIIEIKDLHLSYGEEKVLKGINLKMYAGKHYAVVGPSGAGKTSLVDCLLGLTVATNGAVKVNNTEIGEIGLLNWRRSVGYVTQETILFNMSIRDNIAWNNTEANDEEIEDAAKKANAHEFICSMSNAYNTIVGDRGMRLSGGQRQRIGLARALLGNRSVIILDEATSALDAEAELAIIDAIENLHGDVTVIVIAHNFSTVRFCDQIFLMEKGEIVEAGSWEQLKNANGRFANLMHAQNLNRV